MPFITFEGIDASGKTTQIKILAQRLQEEGHEVLCTRESGGTPLGKAIRHLVQERRDLNIQPLSEVLLYAADRAQHVAEIVLPALERGVFVLSDRYTDSSLAFQGAHLPLERIREINNIATGGLRADFTVLLDLSVVTSRERLKHRGGALDRIEKRDLDYQERVRQIYLLLARQEVHRFLTLDGELLPTQLAEQIWCEVRQRFLRLH